LSISHLSVQAGRAAAKGNINIDMNAEKPVVTAQLKINDIHTEDVIDAIQSIPEKESEVAPQPTQSKSESSELDLSFLKRFDSSINLSVSSVGFRQWMVDQFIAQLSVKDGRLSVAPFAVKSELGQANGQFSFASEQGVNVAKLDIDAKGLALGKFYKMESTYQGIGALQGNIHTQGKSWMEMYANLQGNATVHYVNKEHKHDTKITLKRVDPKDSNAPFDIAINGELQEVPYKITGDIGGPMALIDDAPYPATAHLTFLNVDTKAKGTIAQLFRAKGFDIAFDARTEDLAKVNQRIRIGLPDLRKTQVRAVLRGDYSLLKFEEIRAKSNSATVSGIVQLDFKKKPLHIGGDLVVNKFDLAGMQNEIKSAHKVKSRDRAKSEESVLDKSMSFSALHEFDMDIKLRADNNSSINFSRISVSKFSTRLLVENGTFSVPQLNVQSPMGNISSDLVLETKSKEPVIKAHLTGKNLDLEQFEYDDEAQSFWEAVAGGEVAVQARGSSLHQWLDSVAGDVTLNYQHKRLSQTVAIRLVRELQADVRTAPISVRVNARIGETTSQGFGSVSAPSTWWRGGAPMELKYSTTVKGYLAQAQGQIDDLVSGDGMNVRVSIDNEQALAPSFDQNELVNRIGKVRLLTEITGNYSNIVASRLDGVVGKGKISGSTTVNFRQQPMAVEFDLDVDGLDMSKWSTAKTEPGTGQKKAEKLFSSEKLPFYLLKSATIKGEINGKNLQLRRVKATKLDAGIDLKDGVLQLRVNRLETPNGAITTEVNVDTNSEPPRIFLKLDVPTLNMLEFARNTAAEGLVKGNFSADVSLTAAGNSVAELAAGMNGYVRILMDKGSIDSALLNVYTGGLHAMLGMLTATKVKTTKVNCGICGLQFTKGKGVTEVVLLDTQHSTLVAEGWVDFASETLNVKASPVGKGIPLNIEVPVDIQGPISKPKITPEATSALSKAADIATLWFIPTTAIFVAYDELRSSDKNPCVNMVAPSKESVGLRTLKGAGRVVQDVGSVFSKGLSTLLGVKNEPAQEDGNTAD
ncbi:MAG: AsmA-like C-terminal region-containing protein, partial [Gammaproteobacteria bacterium]